jgi:ubiquinone/menaquinone biosynthesis C-methylase UbiE
MESKLGGKGKIMNAKRDSDSTQEFNRRSLEYEESWEQHFFFDPVHRRVLSMVEEEAVPEAVLDVGCGTGRLLRKAQERWPEARLIGIDAAEGMIEKARQLTPGAIFYVGKAESLPLNDATIDLAFSTLSYHHWSDKLEGLRQIARVLRPSGRLFLADATMPFGLSLFIRHFQENTPTKLLSTFAAAGLEVQAQKQIMTRFILVTVGKRLK